MPCFFNKLCGLLVPGAGHVIVTVAALTDAVFHTCVDEDSALNDGVHSQFPESITAVVHELSFLLDTGIEGHAVVMN